MPRLVRRAPLMERIKGSLDLGDWYLWLSEELNDGFYDEWLNLWATPIGIALNLIFMLARSASRPGAARSSDDVFGDISNGSNSSGWFAWTATFLVQLLALFSFANAAFTFVRQRHYRLFEQPVEIALTTPSARRVRVDSSPMSSSPLRYFQNIISATKASARAYPDAQRDVWEISIWNPKPINLTLFTLFSPGHVLLYYALLPPAALDPRPSVTLFTALAFGILLSLQLSILKHNYSQQAKDSALIHGEVMSEYDKKFVRPIINRPVRDVGIQTREGALSPRGTKFREIEVGVPTTFVNRGFRVNPNRNYSAQYDPDNLSARQSSDSLIDISSRRQSSSNFTPTANANDYVSSFTQSRPFTADITPPNDFSSPLKPHHERLRERTPAKGDGGSLGVYSHAASPLRKAVSANHLRAESGSGLGARVDGSPLKRVSGMAVNGVVNAGAGGGKRTAGEDLLLSRGRRRETGRF